MSQITELLKSKKKQSADNQDKEYLGDKLQVEGELKRARVYLVGIILSYIVTVIFFLMFNTYKVYSIDSVIGNSSKLVIENVCLLGTKSILNENLSDLLFTKELKEILETEDGFSIEEPKIIRVKQLGNKTCRVIIKNQESNKLQSYKFNLLESDDYEFDYKINQIDEEHYNSKGEE